MAYRLLAAFESVFAGKKYRHRDSSNGDWVAIHLTEDLFDLNRSAKFSNRVTARLSVQNLSNSRRGVAARRGDGTLGEIVPGASPVADPGFRVARGPIATIEIGVEVKILHKAMIKQIDRVTGDLRKQVEQFKAHGGRPISVGIVGVNHAPFTVSYEGDRPYKTGPGVGPHPAAEAHEAERRLMLNARPSFDEFLLLRYAAANEPPYTFHWIDKPNTELDYAASLARISSEFERRF